MKRKGFTLIELLAVIFILGLLIAIISPVVSNLLKDSKDNLSEQQKDMIITASKKYMIEHSELLPEGSNRAIVYMDDLVNGGVIDNDKIVDPKTKEEIQGCVVVSYNNEYNQYDYNYSSNDNDCLITVTFDPEGGSVDTTSKQVKFNSTYGELPTPTREGYTFKGWRGKNMFDEESILGSIEGATYEDGYYTFKNNKAYLKYGQYTNGIPVIYKENTQYSITITGYISNSNLSVYTGYDDESTVNILNIMSDEETTKTTRTAKKTLRKIYFSYGSSADVYIKHIQLEEGTEATSYEPYQEYSSDTVVTKSSNHTLHAIWEVAS